MNIERLFNRAGVTSFSVDRRTIRRTIELLEKEGVLENMTINTTNPFKEDEMISVVFYYLKDSPPSEEQVYCSIYVIMNRFHYVQIVILRYLS